MLIKLLINYMDVYLHDSFETATYQQYITDS